MFHMDIRWQEGSLIISPNGEGEHRVLESVVNSLAGLNRVDIHHWPPTGPKVVDLVDNQPISSGIDETLEVVT
jgi:hypothetical protein